MVHLRGYAQKGIGTRSHQSCLLLLLTQSSSTILADFATLNDTSTFVQHQSIRKVSEDTQNKELHSVAASSLLYRELIQSTVEVNNSAVFGYGQWISPGI